RRFAVYCSPESSSTRTTFFYPSRAPRALHSFPTRRSSDLSTGSQTRSGASIARRTRSCSHGLPTPAPSCTLSTAAPIPQPRACRDRKSTRLNSSHVAISYAVLCLKKTNHYDVAEISILHLL